MIGRLSRAYIPVRICEINSNLGFKFAKSTRIVYAEDLKTGLISQIQTAIIDHG